ncbi:MAG: HAD family hydrolase [Ilumatobacteraceae bacterium]
MLFDAGGVLVLPDPTVLGPLLAPLGGDPTIDAHRRAHYYAMAHKSRAIVGEADWHEYDLAYVESIGVRVDDREHAATVLGLSRHAHLWRWPIPETMRALAELAAAAVPMGVVSNASGQVEAELRRSAVCQVGAGPGTAVLCVVDSHVVGVAKPDPRIFEHALDCFPGIDPARIVYIGDSITMDVGGARAAGLHPILIDPYDDHPDADFERIRSVGEVVAMLIPAAPAAGR